MGRLQRQGAEPRDAVASDPEPANLGKSGEFSFRQRRLQLLGIFASDRAAASALPSGASHEIARWALAYAVTFSERMAAIKIAMALGMALNRIEEHLDWLDAQGPRAL